MTENNDSGLDDTFEVLDIRGTARQGNNYLNKTLDMVKISLEKYPVATKTALGATGGYVTGVVFKKVGKTAASAIGGGLLLIQIGYRAGYITINTGRVERDARNLQRRMQVEMRRNQSTLTHVATEAELFLRAHLPGAVGFAAGFLLGLST